MQALQKHNRSYTKQSQCKPCAQSLPAYMRHMQDWSVTSLCKTHAWTLPLLLNVMSVNDRVSNAKIAMLVTQMTHYVC